MGDTKVSDNFTLYEFCRTSHLDYWEENYNLAVENVGKIKALAADLEIIRKRFDTAVIITCGVRSEELNTIVGGSPTSQHCKAEAVDFVMKGVSLREVFEWVVRASGLQYGQVIHEMKGKTEWVHYSLGEPYRDPKRCRMALVFKDGVYEKFA
jgi:zinc D-Ala-D-Ala carboxypeptidase